MTFCCSLRSLGPNWGRGFGKSWLFSRSHRLNFNVGVSWLRRGCVAWIRDFDQQNQDYGFFKSCVRVMWTFYCLLKSETLGYCVGQLAFKFYSMNKYFNIISSLQHLLRSFGLSLVIFVHQTLVVMLERAKSAAAARLVHLLLERCWLPMLGKLTLIGLALAGMVACRVISV